MARAEQHSEYEHRCDNGRDLKEHNLVSLQDVISCGKGVPGELLLGTFKLGRLHQKQQLYFKDSSAEIACVVLSVDPALFSKAGKCLLTKWQLNRLSFNDSIIFVLQIEYAVPTDQILIGKSGFSDNELESLELSKRTSNFQEIPQLKEGDSEYVSFVGAVSKKSAYLTSSSSNFFVLTILYTINKTEQQVFRILISDPSGFPIKQQGLLRNLHNVPNNPSE